MEPFKIRQNVPMKNDKDIHPEAAVAPGYLANHAERVFNRATDAALRQHGISLTLLGPLLWLAWRGPMLQRDLVKASAVKQPAMVATLDKLEAAGLIQRSVVATNKRAANVSITAQGQEVAALGKQVLLDTNARGLEGFSSEEATVFVALLQRFIGNLEE
ncbi:MAG: MarR family winged helix-turn-helix transcriptional regulator [Pseudomonas caspiana]|uniref:MarR family winged helix-turn-helix transcriptional regulator n=1 Tax=Pseudomonas caspiana TaxID=1451454 RepID=UPI0032EFE877